MLLTEIDHVAMAVEDLDAAISHYQGAFGATVEHRRAYPSEHTEEAMLRVADSYVQLIAPYENRGAVKWHLKKKGPGLHHIGYRVADVGQALESVKAQGYEPFDQVPRPGSRNSTIAFVRDPLGVLIELVQVSESEAATGVADWSVSEAEEQALVNRKADKRAARRAAAQAQTG